MDDRIQDSGIKKKLEALRKRTLSEQERLERKLRRSKEQQQLFRFLVGQAIEETFQDYLKICREHKIICCSDHFFTHGYSVFCLDKKTIPRPGEGGLWAPSYVVRLHYAELDAEGLQAVNDFDSFEISAINISKRHFRGKKFRKKRLVGFFERGYDITFVESCNFSELTPELVNETMKHFLDAYLDMRLKRK